MDVFKEGNNMPGAIINLDNEKLLRSYDRIGKAIVDYINKMDLSWEIIIGDVISHSFFIYI
jgi:hypothetical protein